VRDLSGLGLRDKSVGFCAGSVSTNHQRAAQPHGGSVNEKRAGRFNVNAGTRKEALVWTITGFLLYVAGSVAASLIYLWIRPVNKLPNRVLIRCSSCGTKLYKYPHTKRWVFIDSMVWMLVAWVVVFRLYPHISGPLMWLMIFILVFVWKSAQRRLVHAYFMWRHPWRCQDGGHFAPAPQPQGS
jgi:hypothetical protein